MIPEEATPATETKVSTTAQNTTSPHKKSIGGATEGKLETPTWRDLAHVWRKNVELRQLRPKAALRCLPVSVRQLGIA